MADLESAPEVQDSINADKMSGEQLRAKLQSGHDDIEAGKVHDAAAAFSAYAVNGYTPGDRIRLLRTHLKLKVNEFAELVGYSRPYVSMVEHDKLQVNENFLKSVSAATDVSVEWLRGVASEETEENDDGILARAFQYTAERRKAIRDRNLAEAKHPNGVLPVDAETLTEEERNKHQEMIRARGDRLRQLRKEHAQTMMQCAEKVPVSTTSIVQIEHGRREMTKGLAKKLENAYDVSSKWLLYGDELSKDWPCGDKMISFLERHPEVRKYVWEKMMEEDGSSDPVGE